MTWRLQRDMEMVLRLGTSFFHKKLIYQAWFLIIKVWKIICLEKCISPSRSWTGSAEFSPLINTTKPAAVRTEACHVDKAVGGSWHGNRALLFIGDPIV